MEMSMMGQSINIDQYYSGNEKLYTKVGNAQMTLQEMVYDGTTVQSGGMQGVETATEGPLFEEIKSQAIMFSQMNYLTDAYTLELKGLESVDGESCYKILVTDAAGNKTTEFYSLKNNLLIRDVSVTEGPGGQQITSTTSFLDYKDIDGIMFPHKIVTTGAMPMPLEMNVTSYKVNPELDASIFMIK